MANPTLSESFVGPPERWAAARRALRKPVAICIRAQRGRCVPARVPAVQWEPIGELRADVVLQWELWAKVRLLRLIWRGTRDWFDQLISFAIYSILWWLCVIVVIPGPAATLALFAMCDPRMRIEQPEFRDAVAIFRAGFIRSWKVALVTIPLLLILAWNLFFFSGTDHFLVALVPLWLIMIVILFVMTFYAFSMAATMESGPRNALRGAMYVLISRPFASIALSLFLLIVGSLFAVTVLPMVVIGPALFACIVNRVVLDALGVPVIDPDSPTDERRDERERGVNPDPSFLARLKGSKRAQRPE